MMFYTYSHHKPNGTPFYVGKGSTRTRFMLCHKRNARHQRTVEKYGAENIVIRIYECATEEEAFALEKLQIMQCRHDGYDLANYADGGVGGTTGFRPGPETRKKLSEANKRRKPIPRTPEWSEKIAASRRGKKQGPHSAEHRARIAAAHMGKTQAPHSQEQKRKIGEATRKRFEDAAVREAHSEKIRLSWIARRAK